MLTDLCIFSHSVDDMQHVAAYAGVMLSCAVVVILQAIVTSAAGLSVHEHDTSSRARQLRLQELMSDHRTSTNPLLPFHQTALPHRPRSLLQVSCDTVFFQS